jgi:uncharacterized protein (DUF1330 family)
MSGENEKWEEAAKAFAKEVVALARKHGADRLDMSGHVHWQEENWNRNSMVLVWSEGRHAERNRISLRYESTVSLLEDKDAP